MGFPAEVLREGQKTAIFSHFLAKTEIFGLKQASF